MKKRLLILPLLLLLCGVQSIPNAPIQDKVGFTIPELLGMLENPDPAVRENAVLITRRLTARLELKRYGLSQYRGQVSAALKKLLNDKEKRVRYVSALALRRLAYDNEVDRNLPIAVFIEAIKDKEINQPDILREIIGEFWSLGQLAGEAKTRKEEIVTALKDHLNNKDKYIRYTAAIALGELDSSGTKDIILPVFLEALADKDKKVIMFYKDFIASVCGEMGPEAAEAVPAIIRAMKEAGLAPSSSYATALLEIGTPEALDAAAGGRILRLITQFLAYRPLADYCIAVFFGWLFWKSVKLRRQGKKVFHWLLIVPLLAYTITSVAYTGMALTHFTPSFPQSMLEIRGEFLVFSSIGLIPWLLSRLLIWRRERKQKRAAS